jgi:hypothetical protein
MQQVLGTPHFHVKELLSFFLYFCQIETLFNHSACIAIRYKKGSSTTGQEIKVPVREIHPKLGQ